MQLWTTRKTDTRMYFGVVCHKCRSPILFGVDRSSGSGPIRPAAVLTLTCSETACGWRDDYAAAPVARYRKGREGAKAVMVAEAQ